jgi:hypothetical protein
MSLLRKIFVPTEMDEELERLNTEHKERADKAKSRAKCSISRFANSLLELEEILKKNKETTSNEQRNKCLATRTD